CSSNAVTDSSGASSADVDQYDDFLIGTTDWPELTVGRLKYTQGPDDRWEVQNIEANAKLAERLTLSVKKIGLGTVIETIRNETRANIVVNWPALELVGVDEDTPITFNLKDVGADQILTIALRQASADAFDDDKASFSVEEGLVNISTIRELRSKTETRAYDVSWFVDVRLIMSEQLYKRHRRSGWLRGRMKESGERIHIDADDLADWSFFVPGGSSIYDKDGGETSISFQERSGQLMELIQVNVGDQDAWLDQDHWSIYELGDQLVIKTTPQNHDEIKALFQSIRKAQLREFEQQARTLEVVALLRQAEEYRLKQDYRNALEKIDHALRVDPNNLEARILKKIVDASQSR
ncbi:MAG: hypothetical protein AAF085_15455, partial [Planctomycetota bacterium]